jgi:hypothetical protein
VKVKANQPSLYQQIKIQSEQTPALKQVEHHEKTRDRNSYGRFLPTLMEVS